jgi:hypothetical protein
MVPTQSIPWHSIWDRGHVGAGSLRAAPALTMLKRSPREKLFEWRVIKIRSTPATLIGYFKAATADKQSSRRLPNERSAIRLRKPA